MKKLYFTAVAFLFLAVANAQIINFPDANFKAKLLAANSSNTIAVNSNGYNTKVDLSGNGEIELNEAIAIDKLNVDSSSINSLEGIENFINLRYLFCSSNPLTNLNLDSNTMLLELRCSNTPLTNLNFNNNLYLNTLICNFNQLTSLNLSGNNNLYYLDCAYNLLTSLDLSNNTALEVFYCQYNQIISLDLSRNTTLTLSYCKGNQLSNLFVKNNSNESLNFENNPNLQYICTDDGQIADVQAQIFANNIQSTCHVNSYCSFIPGGTFYTIQGNNKFDENSNGCDAMDFALPNLKYNITDGTNSGSIISNNTGNYSIPISAGTHTITPILQNPSYFNVSPTTATIAFPTTTSPAIQDFCITANGIHQDIEVVIIPITVARPGFNATYKIIYKNKGNVTVSGNVVFSFSDAAIDFVSAMPAITSQNSGSLYWDYTNLLPFETREIIVVLNMNSPQETPALNAGDNLFFEASITPFTNDEATGDNIFEMDQTIVNSFDPNDKTCLEGNNIIPAKVGDYVHYMIRFENTGTFPAENVVVKDMIDTDKFDITTLLPINSSHDFVTKINGNKVEFIFENINLPFDNATNDGYVVFKIKTKSTLVLGNTFSNSANIYFDYNFPIITNTATTTVANPLASQDFEFENYFSLYPNPAKNILNINTKNNIVVSSLNIYNTLGQLVQVITKPNQTIDVSDLKSGNYVLKITSDKGTSSSKFLKE